MKLFSHRCNMAKKNVEPVEPTEALEWFAIARTTKIGGHLKHQWLRHGYDLNWREGEKRLAPASLVGRSEVTLTIVQEWHKNRKAGPQAPTPTGRKARSVPPDVLKERYESEPRIKVLCTHGWRNGILASEFIALEMPCSWYEGEIREIPPSLWEQLQLTGNGNFTADPRQVAEAEKDGKQSRWEFKRRQWYSNYSAQVARQVARYEAEQTRQAKEQARARRRIELGI